VRDMVNVLGTHAGGQFHEDTSFVAESLPSADGTDKSYRLNYQVRLLVSSSTGLWPCQKCVSSE